MRPDQAAADTDKTGGRARKRAGKIGAVWLCLLALFLLTALLAGGGAYLYRQLHALQQEEDPRLAILRTELDGKARQVALLQRRWQEATKRLDESDRRAEESARAFARLRRRLDGEARWVAAEARYLLAIASHRLTLEREIDTALAALQTAERLLQRIAERDLATARERLRVVIDDLQAVARIDGAGLAGTLAELAAGVEDLPLNELLTADPPPAAAPENEQTPRTNGLWNTLATPVWRELRSLVEISKTGAHPPIVWPPERRYFLYQHLRLQLEAARLALLLRDAGAFHGAAQAAIDGLERYFDPASPAVAAALDALRPMLALDLAPPLPSLAAATAALDDYLAAQVPTLPRRPPPAPADAPAATLTNGAASR